MTFIKYLVSLLFLLVLALGAGAFLIFADAPLMVESSALTPSDLRRAQRVIASVYSEASVAGEPASLVFSESDIDLLITYGLNTQHGGKASTEFSDRRVRLQISARMPANAFGDYLNTDLTLTQNDNVLALEALKLGKLEIPGWLADRLLHFTHEKLKQNVPEYATLLAAIRTYSLEEDQLELSYSLKPEILDFLADTGRELFISAATSERLLAHSAHLDELAEQHSARNSVSLAEILIPMFDFAHSRQGDAAEENRAAILVMALHVMDIDLSRMLQGAASPLPERKKLRLTLYRRNDFARHFLGSAALAISAEPGIADTIALLKEMDDTQEGGSGFSFTDLAADRSGIRFAELAVSDNATARALQELLREAQEESYFAYDFRKLPEFMDEATFRTNYTDTESSSYLQMLDEIDSNVAQTPLFLQLKAL